MAILAELAVEQEATPGTAETIVQADVLSRIRNGFTIEPDAEQIDPDEIQATSSSRPLTIGRKLISIGASYQLRGPGDLTTNPTIADKWEAAMFDGLEAETIPIGAITSGPFLAGEIITGATSAATGIILQQTATSATSLPYAVLTGVFQAEVIDGGESGAQCTSSGPPVAGGYAFRPADSDFDGAAKYHCTAQLRRNGFQWTARGALATLRFPFRNGQPCFVEQTFTGALTSRGTQALFGVTTYPEESVAVPRFLNAGIVIGSYSPSGVLDFDLTINNTYEPNEDANDSSADGVKWMDYDKDRPTITLDPDQVPTATYDYFTTFLDGTPFYLEWTLGSAAGAKWTFACREAQFQQVSAGERANRPRFPLTIALNGNDNNELLIWQH